MRHSSMASLYAMQARTCYVQLELHINILWYKLLYILNKPFYSYYYLSAIFETKLVHVQTFLEHVVYESTDSEV